MRKILILLTILALCACQKDPVSWDSRYAVPLIKTELALDDLIPDSLLEYDDRDNVFLVFNQEIMRIGIDSLVSIEGDTIEKDFSIAPVIEFEFQPGTTFISETDEFEFSNIEVQLREAKIKAGKIILTAENTIPSILEFIVTLPGASLDGVPMQITALVPRSSDAENGYLTFEVDLTDYELDLTGETGNSFNELAVYYDVRVPEDASPVTVYDSDFVNLQISYEGLEVEYAFGYLGQEELDIDESSDFEFVEELEETLLNISGATADITFGNSFGVDLQAFIYQLQGWNSNTGNSLALNHSMIGSTISMSRANFDYTNLSTFTKTFSLNESNSNLDAFVELLPDSISIQANAQLNPFGNISNYNDFVVDESQLTCHIDFRIPFKLGLSNLALEDTSDFVWNIDNPELSRATLFLAAENSFPAEITMSLIALDEEGKEIINLNDYLADNASELISGRSEDEPGKSILVYELDESAVELLNRGKQLVFYASFETTNYPELVEFYAHDKLQLQLSADVELTLEVE